MSTPDNDAGGLEWLLDNLQSRTPGVHHVLVLSKDGLKMCFTSGLDTDRADQLSAIASGIQSLSLSASAEFGHGLGAGQSMVEFPAGCCSSSRPGRARTWPWSRPVMPTSA